IVDLKTCRDASRRGFGSAVAAYRYHAQAASYVDAVEHCTGRRLPFVFVAVKKEPPYLVGVYRISDEQLELGRTLYRELLDQLDLCRSTNQWPGYAVTEMD